MPNGPGTPRATLCPFVIRHSSFSTYERRHRQSPSRAAARQVGRFAPGLSPRRPGPLVVYLARSAHVAASASSAGDSDGYSAADLLHAGTFGSPDLPLRLARATAQAGQ